MSEKYITLYFDEKIKKIWFPGLGLRLWRHRNGTNQSEIMKKKWQDPEFRENRAKKYNLSDESRKKLSDLMRKRMTSEKAPEYLRKTIETKKKRYENGDFFIYGKPSRNLVSPFFMVDGIMEEIVEMDRKPSHGVVIESQQMM